MQLSNLPRSIARCAFAGFVGLIMAASAGAQNLGTLFSDLWWNPAESGWGVTVDHQQDVMFLTFFVYRADNSTYWVTATLQKVGSTGASYSSADFHRGSHRNAGPFIWRAI